MKKRSLVATIAAVACIAAVGIGSTFAYFTSTTEVLGNTFTMGNVAITLDEDFNNKTDIAAGTTEAYAQKILPNEVIDKKPTVTVNDGSEEAWVFVEITNDESVFTLDIDSDVWTLKKTDGNTKVYLHKASMTAGESADVFTQATVENLTNDKQGANASISIKAYAIQKSTLTADEAFAQLFPTPVENAQQ